MNEDFELAIEYKKKISALEKKLVSEEDFESKFWNNKPLLTEHELYLKLVEIDATFAKNFSDKAFSLGKTKTQAASTVVCLINQKQVSSLKTKQNCEDSI